MNELPVKHLNQVELSRRWSISPRTLERWRWIGQGPQFLKVRAGLGNLNSEISGFSA